MRKAVFPAEDATLFEGVGTYYAVRLDESHAVCEPDLLARCGGRLWTVYVYNADEVTHLCESTPSYWLEEMENIPDVGTAEFLVNYAAMSDDDREQLDEALRECANDERGIYVHAHEIEAVPLGTDGTARKVRLGEFDSMDEAREAYQGSPVW